MSRVRCLPVAATEGQAVGGKAEGLRRLLELGLPSSEAFVIVGATPEGLDDATFARILEHYASIGGGAVAVRSSAIGEDSEGASFAGQYDTFLNIKGPEALRRAIVDCLRSLGSERATAYRQEQLEPAADVPMCVVVQKMVQAKAAGVLFSVDPVSGRRDRMVIDAVQGLGDALVSGEVTPDHFVLDSDGTILERDLAGKPESQAEGPSEAHAEDAEAVVSDAVLKELHRGACHAVAAYGAPLDLEWAIDADGALVYLQARPITHLAADPRELDCMQSPGDYYTKCNIGEMMPGAVTPLTFSITGRGIEVGMQRMYVRCGVIPAETSELQYVAMFHGHMFLNLTRLLGISGRVGGSTAEQACIAVCGRRIEEVERSLPAEASHFVQYTNLFRYAGFLLRAHRRVPALKRVVEELAFQTALPAAELWRDIDRKLPAMWTAFDHHLACSSPAGAMAPILLRVVAESDPPDEADVARVAGLLAGATDVESADIAAGVDRVVEALLTLPDHSAFTTLDSPEAGLQWLRSDAAGAAREAFEDYLKRHGHRAVRELELHQRGWVDDPLPLVASIRSALKGRLHAANEPKRTGPSPAGATSPSSKPLSRGLRALVARAHDAVRLREQTKSLLVLTGQRFKVAYRALGDALAREGLLPDADAVFFLTHAELGDLVKGADPAHLAALASARRQTHVYQMSLVFEEVFQGVPEPIVPVFDAGDGTVLGKPVSVGVVRGRARVVRTLEEASALEPGEILIAPITDVGWTPYFSMLGGLATDVGSAVSHGAVVAREYGIPCVVGTRVGTTTFRTGDLVELDGSSGCVRRIDPDETDKETDEESDKATSSEG